MTIYLYKKTHNITGLKYLGKTKQDPFKYKGSGIYWTAHLKKHGNDVTTEILLETATDEELIKAGLYYSELWNVVNSNDWANLKPEAGDGGGMPEASRKQFAEKMKGHPNWSKLWSLKAKQNLAQVQKENLAKLTSEELTARMKNSCCRPDSYTPERIENMRKGMIGKKKTKTPKLLAAIEAKRERSIQNMLNAAEKNRGRTWKLIDGKRVWMDRESQNY
jgi:hypothetical protein